MNIFVGPKFFDRRIADHNCERRCVRQRSEDVSKNCMQVSRKRDHRVVGSERRVFDRSGVKGGKNDGRGGKEVSSVALDEARSRTYQCNDQIGRMGRKKSAQIARECLVSLAVRKARDLERHLVGVQRIRGFLNQIRTQIVCEDFLGPKIGAERVQQQHPLRLRSRRVPCCKGQQNDSHPCAARPPHGIPRQSTILVRNQRDYSGSGMTGRRASQHRALVTTSRLSRLVIFHPRS